MRSQFWYECHDAALNADCNLASDRQRCRAKIGKMPSLTPAMYYRGLKSQSVVGYGSGWIVARKTRSNQMQK